MNLLFNIKCNLIGMSGDNGATAIYNMLNTTITPRTGRKQKDR
jgi:hypothetical protein